MAFGNKPFMNQAAKLGWFGIHPVVESPTDIETGTSTTSATQQQQEQKQEEPEKHHQYQHTQQINIEAIAAAIDATPSSTPPSPAEEADITQPTSRRVASISRTSLVDGSPRYRDLHLRTRLRAAQISVIAIERMKNDIRIKNEQKFDEEQHVRLPGVRVEGESATAAENQTSANDEEGPKWLSVELASSRLGWIFFPFTFIWNILYRYTIVDCSKEGKEKYWYVTFIMSIVWISGVSYGMVELTRIAGCLLNIPATAMVLKVLAAGTSIPDALASISVAPDGAGDMAVSNAISSNVFDILLGLGVPWFLGALILPTPEGDLGPITIKTSPITEVIIPIIILFSIMMSFIAISIALKWTMRRLLGYLLCGLYLVFVTYTLLDVYVFKIGQ